jgi:uncharacterized integral membrane protein
MVLALHQTLVHAKQITMVIIVRIITAMGSLKMTAQYVLLMVHVLLLILVIVTLVIMDQDVRSSTVMVLFSIPHLFVTVLENV